MGKFSALADDVVKGRDPSETIGAADYKALKNDIATLRADMKKLFEDSLSLAREESRRTVAKGREAADQAQENLNEATAQVEGKIRANPLVAVGVALGVGALFGAITRR